MSSHERDGGIEADGRLSDQIGVFAPRGPSGYRRTDSRIREDIVEYLTRHGEIDVGRIEVIVEDGEVSLTGTVTSREGKRLAQVVAEQCSGVKGVRNELTVGWAEPG